MLYFTKIAIDDSPLIDAESQIRKYALKRHILLDFKSSASNITEDKYFFGNDNKKELLITRIRSSLEWFFPKLIVSIPKQTHFDGYKVRYCLASTVILLFLIFLISQSIFYIIIDEEMNENIFYQVVFLGIFLIMTFIELKLTKRKISQAIKNV